MAQLDVDQMIERFRERALAVKKRNIPPVEGPKRQQFIDQANHDFMDYSILSDAKWSLEDGILTLKIDLAPKE